MATLGSGPVRDGRATGAELALSDEIDGPAAPKDARIGCSREGRPISAYRIGDGPRRVSLIGGCHADEPVGPRFLRRLVRFLAGPGGTVLRKAATWFVVPHVNPDGAAGG